DTVERPDANRDVDVARRPALHPRVTSPSHPDPLAVVDPGGHLELERRVLDRAPVAAAALAGRLDDRPGAVAARTGSRADHLSEDRPRDLLDAADARARRARDRRGAGG